jgi:phage tail P2-like protein
MGVNQLASKEAIVVVSYPDHLLPANATDLERIFSASARRIQDIPTPIDKVKRPFETTASFLPFVGWEYSVDVWFDNWSETTKRAITARSLLLHQKKGTAFAIREYVRYAGGKVRKIERPPMHTFSGPSLTREQRQAWLASLPQVRVFRLQTHGFFPRFKSFYGTRQRNSFFTGTFAVPSTALSRLHRRAIWVVNGVETDTRVTELGSFFRLHFKSKEGKRIFCGRPIRKGRFFQPSDAFRRIVTIEPQPRLAWRAPVGPTLNAVTSEPELVKVRGQRGRSVFCSGNGGPAFVGRFFRKSTAQFRIFDRFAVHDGRKALPRPNVQFMGSGRYGFPAHTARLHVSIPGKLSRYTAGFGFAERRSKFWTKSTARARIDQIRAAVQSAKRLSDRILLVIGPTNRFIAGRPFIAGEDTLIVGHS